MFLQFSADESRSLLCFEKVVLEDQQAVHYSLKNGIPWKEVVSQGKLLASSLGNPKSAPLKGLYYAIYLSCFPQFKIVPSHGHSNQGCHRSSNPWPFSLCLNSRCSKAPPLVWPSNTCIKNWLWQTPEIGASPSHPFSKCQIVKKSSMRSRTFYCEAV